MDRATGADHRSTTRGGRHGRARALAYHSIHERLEFTHRDYAQAEYGAQPDRRRGGRPLGRHRRGMPYARPGSSGASPTPRSVATAGSPGPSRIPTPASPTAAPTRAQRRPPLPVVGLPDCQGRRGLRTPDFPASRPVEDDRLDPGLDTDDFEARGIPVPENYSAPRPTPDSRRPSASTSRRSGSATSCSRLLLRAVVRPGAQHRDADRQGRRQRASGLRLGEPAMRTATACTTAAQGPGTWACPNPGNPRTTLPPITDQSYKRMRAQVTTPPTAGTTPRTCWRGVRADRARPRSRATSPTTTTAASAALATR